jgi:adenylosuccinate synthase
MAISVVVGLQWGDEAKGKMVDLLCQDADIVARYNGGDNAGHTVVNEYGTFKLRLTPNGIANPKTRCVIGPGVVVNLATLFDELEFIRRAGIDLLDRLWISPRCHIVMPYHPMVEEIYETVKGSSRTGTTRRGMGPVYADKVSYNGIRLGDLAHPDRFIEKLRVQLALKNPVLQAFGMQPLSLEAVVQEKLSQFERLRSMVREPYGMIQESLRANAHILLEGAQGALLDNDWGTYPFVTASTTIAGGATAGLGLSPRSIQRVIGVAKAYTSRVGAGPMPTELEDETGQLLRDEGQEYGTVTGRPRRCGWLDADLIAFTGQLNGCTELALTKLDVLDRLPVIRIAVGYRHPDHPDRVAHYWEGDANWLAQCTPVYIEVKGWLQSTRQARHFDQLPVLAQAFVRKVEQLCGIPVGFISIGPGRDEIIRLNSLSERN